MKTIAGKITSLLQSIRACVGDSLKFIGIATLWFPIYSIILNMFMVNNVLSIKYITYISIYLFGFIVGVFVKQIREMISRKSIQDDGLMINSLYGLCAVTALLVYVFNYIKPSTAYLLSQYENIVHNVLKYAIPSCSRFTIVAIVMLILVAMFSRLFTESYHIEEIVFNFGVFITITFAVYFGTWLIASFTGNSVYIM